MAQITVEAQYIADTAQYVQALRRAADATNALANSIPVAGSRSNTLATQTRDAGRAAQESAKGFTVLKAAVGTAIGIAAVGMITKFAGSLKSFARESFDAAARAEELDIAMKAIGESTGQGYKAIKAASQAIRDNGIELAASQQIAIEFAQNQLDMAAASKVARVAQDLAVIAGTNSTATTQLLTRAIITGNSMLLKSAGISRQAGEGYAQMAKELGKSRLALTAQERQQAVVNLILEEGAKVAGTYEASMNSAGKVLRSFKRIINDIQVEVGRILLDAFGPLIKATYDLISAFSKSLRSGGALSETIKNLNIQFTALTTPLLESIKGFTEMVKSGQELQRVGNIVSSLMPILSAFLDLVRAGASVFGGLFVNAARDLASILESVAPLIERISRFIEGLPSPVKAAAGALLLMNIALRKTSLTLAMMNASVIRFGKTMVVQMRLASTAVISFRTAALMSFHAIKAGFRALMASIGPVGALIIGLGVAFEYFAGKSADASALVDNLKNSVDELTGAFTEASAAAVSAKLRMDISSEDIAAIQEMGISISEMTQAAMAGGDATEAYRRKIMDLIRAQGGISSPEGQILLETLEAFNLVANASVEATRQLESDAASRADALSLEAQKTQAAAERSRTATREMAIERRLAYASMTDAERAAAEASIATGKAMSQLELTTTAAVNAMKTAFERLDATLNRFMSADKVRDSLLAMRKQLRSNKEGIDEFDGAARKNRDTVYEYVQNLQTMAKSFDDPRDQLKLLEEGLKEVGKELVGQGKKPEKSKLYRDLKASVDAAKTEVDNMADAAANAEAAGVTVTEALVRGIVETVGKNTDPLAAAGAASGQAVIDGLYGADGVDLGSPSKKAIYAGEMMILGLVSGLQRGTGRAVNAMRGMMRGVIDAGQDEAGVHSESDLTYFLGKMLAEGASSGITKNSKKAEDAARLSANKIMSAFGESLNFGQGMRGGTSFMDQASAFFGNLPSMPSPLEGMFGKKGAEGFLKKHEKDLVAMQKVFMDMDLLSTVIMSGAASLREIHSEMTGVQGLYKGEPIEAPSALMEALGSEGSLSSAISMMSSMTEQIDNAYVALLVTVNKGQRKAIQGQREAAAAQLKGMTEHVAGLMIRRDQIKRELTAIEKTYNDNVASINTHHGNLIKSARTHLNDMNTHFNSLIKVSETGIKNLQKHYAGLEKSARASVDAVRKRYESLIPDLQAQLKATTDAFEVENRVLQGLISERDRFTDQVRSGFKSFVNSLQFATDKSTKAVLKETKKLANGITVTLEREIMLGGGGENIAAALQGRLEAVQDFGRNIRTLMGRGLDPSLVQEFLSAGVSAAGDVVRELSGVSSDEISAINRIQQELGAEVANFQEYGVQQFHAAAIAQQEAIVAPLETARQQAEAALLLAEQSRARDTEAAQAHLDMILAMRDLDLENAQAYLTKLQEDKDREVGIAEATIGRLETARDDALAAEFLAYENQRKVLEAEALLIDNELNLRAAAVRKYFAKLMSGPRGLPVMMRQTGVKAMQGLLQGLNAIAPQVLGRARDIANSIRHEIESALRISSPSRVMENIGAQIADGLIQGMESSERAVAGAARGLAEATMMSVSMPSFEGMSPMNGSGFGSNGVNSSNVSNISINVNAGMGTDGAEVGRQVVEAIRKYERRSGQVFVSV